MKPTNLDIEDAACLHVVHILQHLTSRRTTRSTQDPMVNVPKKNLSARPAGKYSKSTKKTTRRHHEAIKGKSGLEVELDRGLVASRSIRSKKKLSVEKWRVTHISSEKEQEKWIEHYVDRETAVARKRVQDAEIAIM